MITKIRWYYVDDPGVKRMFVYNSEGEPSPIYRIGLKTTDDDGNTVYIYGQPLLDALKSDTFKFPDRRLNYYIPGAKNCPPKFIRVSNGFGGVELVLNPDYAIAVEEWELKFNNYVSIFYNSFPHEFVLMRKYTFRTLEDGENVRWEAVDESKPYLERFTPIEVVPGLYSKTYEWKEVDVPDTSQESIFMGYITRSCAVIPWKALRFITEPWKL